MGDDEGPCITDLIWAVIVGLLVVSFECYGIAAAIVFLVFIQLGRRR